MTKKHEDGLNRFVAQHVLVNQTTLIQDILTASSSDLLEWEDVENFFFTDDRILDEYRDSYPLPDIDGGYTDQEVIDLVRDNCWDYQEILEWWLVDDWFAKILRDKGQPVLEYGLSHWWGRTCSGQMISMDFVIKEIYNEVM